MYQDKEGFFHSKLKFLPVQIKKFAEFLIPKGCQIFFCAAVEKLTVFC